MDNVIISCTVGDEEALVDKASSCTSSRRRLVRQNIMMTAKLSEQTSSVVSGMLQVFMQQDWLFVSLSMNKAYHILHPE